MTLADDDATVQFAGGAVVTVGRDDGELAQRGPDTDRIDLLYRLHYSLAGLLVLAALGVGLLTRRRPRLGFTPVDGY